MASIRKGFGHVTLKKTQNKTGNASLLFPTNENRHFKESRVDEEGEVFFFFFCRAVKIPVVLGEVELNQTGNR